MQCPMSDLRDTSFNKFQGKTLEDGSWRSSQNQRAWIEGG